MNFFDLVDAQATHCPDAFKMRLARAGSTLHPLHRDEGESDEHLWRRVVRMAQLIFIAGAGPRVVITCNYEERYDAFRRVVSDLWFVSNNRPMTATLQ